MENKTPTYILIVLVLLLYVMFFTYLVVRYVIPQKNNSVLTKANDKSEDINIPINNQTDFYNKSVQHAEKVLSGQSFDPQYGQSGFYGNGLIDMISKINDDTKQAIRIAMRYFSIEPSQARNNEQLFRAMAQKEGVPLWFIILREASKKAIPEFMQSDIQNSDSGQQGKVVPLYQKTG